MHRGSVSSETAPAQHGVGVRVELHVGARAVADAVVGQQHQSQQGRLDRRQVAPVEHDAAFVAENQEVHVDRGMGDVLERLVFAGERRPIAPDRRAVGSGAQPVFHEPREALDPLAVVRPSGGVVDRDPRAGERVLHVQRQVFPEVGANHVAFARAGAIPEFACEGRDRLLRRAQQTRGVGAEAVLQRRIPADRGGETCHRCGEHPGVHGPGEPPVLRVFRRTPGGHHAPAHLVTQVLPVVARCEHVIGERHELRGVTRIASRLQHFGQRRQQIAFAPRERAALRGHRLADSLSHRGFNQRVKLRLPGRRGSPQGNERGGRECECREQERSSR